MLPTMLPIEFQLPANSAEYLVARLIEAKVDPSIRVTLNAMTRSVFPDCTANSDCWLRIWEHSGESRTAEISAGMVVGRAKEAEEMSNPNIAAKIENSFVIGAFLSIARK